MEYNSTITSDFSDRVSDSFLAVNSFGYYKDMDRSIITKRENGRRDYQILYIDKGYGFFLIDSKTVKVEQGSIVIIRPGEKNLYEFPAESASSYYWIHFSGTGVQTLLTSLKLTNRVFYTGSFHQFKEQIEKMSHASIKKDFTTDIFLSAALQSLLSLAAKKIYIPSTSIHRVMEIIRNDSFNSMSNTQYAQMCNLSEAHFIKKFKSVTGTTPHRYKVNLLVDKAIEILTSTNLNISETAYMLGFEDSLYFSRLFKKKTGLSPQKYLESAGKKDLK